MDERRRIAFLASELARHAALGSAVGSIRIPRIGADFVLVYGTGTEELEKGPGIYTQSIYPGTRFPGLGATTAIAGHRTTFLAPFRHIDELRRGDRILVDMPYAHFVYTVMGHRSVLPSDVYAAIRHAGYSRLVLSACTPCSAPPNGCWCMRASPRPPGGGGAGAPPSHAALATASAASATASAASLNGAGCSTAEASGASPASATAFAASATASAASLNGTGPFGCAV